MNEPYSAFMSLAVTVEMLLKTFTSNKTSQELNLPEMRQETRKYGHENGLSHYWFSQAVELCQMLQFQLAKSHIISRCKTASIALIKTV